MRGQQYRVRQKLVAIGDDFWIENDSGERVYKVDGKALRVRKTLIFEDPAGNELCKIQERMLRIKDSMEIEGPDGGRLAMVKKALITPLRDRWTSGSTTAPIWTCRATSLTTNTPSERGGTKSPRSPRSGSGSRHLRRGDRAWPGRRVILAVAVAIDTMAHEGH